MKGVIATAAVLLSVNAAAQVVQLDFERRPQTQKKLRRRADTLQVDIDNLVEDSGYFIDVAVGTPSQKLSLQLDTGSSDIWVPSSGSKACQAKSNHLFGPEENGGCSKGSFTASKSTTFRKGQEGTFKIEYVDRTSAQGQYFQDNFQLGDVTIQNMTMGLAEETDISFGLVGIGYRSNEASVQTTKDSYPNLPIALQTSGNIKTVAYSLWLNDLDASKGNILFGGIDTEKFQGDLALLDLIPNPKINQVVEFDVPLTGIQAVSSSGFDDLTSTGYPISVLLDSGTTLSYLPANLTQQIWNEVGAAYSEEIDAAFVPCNIASSQSYFSFQFGGSQGPRINVTMKELVQEELNIPFPSGPSRGRNSCSFGIQVQPPTKNGGEPDSYLLGDSFMRSAYVVYDLVNNQVGLAQTKFKATSSNVIPFTSYGATIPTAKKVATQNSTQKSDSVSEPGYKAGPGFQAADNAATSNKGLSLLGVVGVSLVTIMFIYV